MSEIRDQKEYQNLDLQLWLVKDEESGKWRNEAYITGNDIALETMRNSLQSLLDIFQMYGKGTKIYKCNPPSDFDPVSGAKDHGIQIRWLDKLNVRIGLDALDNEPFILEDFVVSISMNPRTMKLFIDRIQTYLNSKEISEAVCGLRFSPEWHASE